MTFPTYEEAKTLVRRLVAERYPAAEAVWLAGSIIAGTATANSDLDVVLIFPSVESAWRETLELDGVPVEVFAHDLATFDYFCHHVDRPSGRPVLPAMVVHGLELLGQSHIATRVREIARQTIDNGPAPLSADDVLSRRYALTCLADDLPGASVDAERAVAAQLYLQLVDFALRAAGRWSGNGKHLARELRAFDPALAARVDEAFSALWRAGDIAAVSAIVAEILAPYGGRLSNGYVLRAPPAWRSAD